VILVDGGSRDDTRERARGGVDLLLTCEPGRAMQMNLGAAAARGRLLWFLHADSRISPAVLDQLSAAAAAGQGWGRFDVRLSGDDRLLRLIERLMVWRSRLTGIATGDQAIFVRRDWFTAIGGFPPLPLMEDVAISRRLRRRAWPRRLTARVQTSGRRWQRHGIVRTVLLMWRLRLLFFLGVPAERLAASYRSCASPTVES
jgi:rSAM/selenodomain-associated transferase 2